MTAARNYSSVARLATLAGAISNSATVMTVDVTTGFPTVPFTLVIDPGRTAEEIVTVTNIVGPNLTIVRGEDGSAAQPHDAAAEVRHMATARDYREPAEHVGASSGVHGVAGALVGNTDTQSLDNKTITAFATDHVPLTVKAASGQTSHLVNVTTSADVITAYLTAAGGWVASNITSTGNLVVAGSLTAASTAFTTLTATTATISALTATTLTAGASTATNLTVSGATVLAALTAAAVSCAAVTASGRIATPGIDGSVQSIFSTSSPSTTPLIAQVADSSTGAGISVRDEASTPRAGFWGEANGWQAYHGGSTTNLIPWRFHTGIENVTIHDGNRSATVTADFTGLGFTITPVVNVTAHQFNPGVSERWVFANIEDDITLTGCKFRIITSGDDLTADTDYTVHWTAVQMTPDDNEG